MTNAERILRAILGPVRADLRPLILAVEITGSLLFVQHLSMDDIQFTKLVYPAVAHWTGSNPSAASRRVERLSHLCWSTLVEQELVSFYLGRELKRAPSPGSMMIYLAVYAQFNAPFFSVIERDPSLLPAPRGGPADLPLPV